MNNVKSDTGPHDQNSVELIKTDSKAFKRLEVANCEVASSGWQSLCIFSPPLPTEPRSRLGP